MPVSGGCVGCLVCRQRVARCYGRLTNPVPQNSRSIGQAAFKRRLSSELSSDGSDGKLSVANYNCWHRATFCCRGSIRSQPIECEVLANTWQATKLSLLIRM